MKELVSDIISRYFGISLKSKVKVPNSVVIDVVNGQAFDFMICRVLLIKGETTIIQHYIHENPQFTTFFFYKTYPCIAFQGNPKNCNYVFRNLFD